ncbi:MAG: protein TolQ [Rickettsiales bacterium]|nr:protein TolQ [Pseudomonadota bacterium]MDA0965683.1 protein TolQ [Pseudomonadota bacterium]MDG4543007.1 protein TolQ [Rickettsiales bacterium]MDG4544545.1 protein TolQ [Rickettsiales bacterium]MDG4546667.1 protein TolQ [Rickettsiales bacterium]
MASNAVDVATVAGSVASVDMSVWGLIAQSDMVVKFVMFLLVASSFWCWAIVYSKWSSYRRMRYKSAIFENAYRSSKGYKALYGRVNKSDPGSAMAAMFIEGMKEVQNAPSALQKRADAQILNQYKERIYNSLSRVKNNYIEKMENNLIILATVGSAAPFIGLFGTVWGIVNSFQAIAATKNTTLAVVAPGIAEALLATAIGLFAAIPAVVFYNLFSNEIRKVASKLEDYANELSTVLAHNEE